MKIKSDKIYYNTEYRKKIKALSKFNIFIKDRITKKDIINEKKKKKEKKLKIPLIFITFPKFYSLLRKKSEKWIYTRTYDLKLFFSFFISHKNIKIKKKKYINIKFFNQLILTYYFNGVVYFFLIFNWLWISEWNKWTSLTDIIDYSFFSFNIIFKYIISNLNCFLPFFIKSNNSLYNSFLFHLNSLEYNINIYNIKAFNEMTKFFVLLNVEDIRYQHDKRLTPEKKWKSIRKVTFDYFNINILNDVYFCSFFSFCIYEFNIIYNICNYQYVILTFFDYWKDIIIEKNYAMYKKKAKSFQFKSFSLNNLDWKIIQRKTFKIRIKYNLFLSNIDYFFFFKNFAYNFYIRNIPYFFFFSSQRQLFIRYMNATSYNKGSLSMWEFDYLFKRSFFFIKKNNMNHNLNLWNIERLDNFFNFFYKKDNFNNKHIINNYLNNFNIKFLKKIKESNKFFYSIDKFFYFNLLDFYNEKNRYEGYKDVMKIESVYQYRFANSSFRTMDEFMIAIFKTPMENYVYFDKVYRDCSYAVVFEIYKKMEKNFFWMDLFHINNIHYAQLFEKILKYSTRVFKIKIFFFKFNYLWKLFRNEDADNILKIDIFSEFYDIFEEKKFFFLIKKLKKKHFYKRLSFNKYLEIIKRNSMYYLHFYDLKLLFNGWFSEFITFYRFMNFVKIYNYLLGIYSFFDNYKYLRSFKEFYFQLIYENIEYNLIFILIFYKKIKIFNKFNYINNKHVIDNNFIYRKYMLNTWLEFNYYDDLFDDLDLFVKENYSIKLSKWILRYFYEKAELHNFYTESLTNNYIDKKRLLL